jgi:hypothetical protein
MYLIVMNMCKVAYTEGHAHFYTKDLIKTKILLVLQRKPKGQVTISICKARIKPVITY